MHVISQDQVGALSSFEVIDIYIYIYIYIYIINILLVLYSYGYMMKTG